MATSGAGPKPPPKSLPVAVHEALSAQSVPGISARVQFTNHLVNASSIEGSDPLLSGASGRLWASPEGKLRLELQSEGGGGDSQVLIDEGRFEIYDGSAEIAYRGELPGAGGGAGSGSAHQPPSLEQIEQALAHLGQRTALSGATPSDVAGQPTYTVQIEPKSDGGLIGGVSLAWDAAHGIPLRAALYAKGDSSPVLSLEATEIAYEAVPSSVFAISAPPGTKVVNLSPPGESSAQPVSSPPSATSSLEAELAFKLNAPASLDEMPLAQVRKVQIKGKTGALITYGHGLSGVAVFESPSAPGAGQPASTAPGGLSLPTISIDGASAEELETALGTVLRFSRGGVDYVLAGSVSPATAEAAARGL